MVRQTMDSKFGEYALGNVETNLPNCDKQFPVAVKKMPLRDVQNEKRTPNTTGNSPLSMSREQSMDAIKVSGIKRASTEDPASLPRYQSPSSSVANAHLVYVRRKPEAEIGKSNTCDGRSINADCHNLSSLGHSDETIQPKLQIKEPKVSTFPAFAPMAVVSTISTSTKPSVSLPLGQSNTRFAPAELNYCPIPSAIALSNNQNGMKNLHWEERYHQLQILLKKLDESDQEDYIQMLRSLTSVELSRHAVELEKRSIQLSLEEAKEVQRVGVLNVLGKSGKSFKAPSSHPCQQEK